MTASGMENATHQALPMLTRNRSSMEGLSKNVPLIVERVMEVFQAKNKDVKSRNGILGVLRELIIVRQGGLTTDIPRLIPCVMEAISDTETTLRTKGLRV